MDCMDLGAPKMLFNACIFHFKGHHFGQLLVVGEPWFWCLKGIKRGMEWQQITRIGLDII